MGQNNWGAAGAKLIKGVGDGLGLPGPLGALADKLLTGTDKNDMDRGWQFTRNSYPAGKVQSGNRGATNLEDPTYLGFSLYFGGPLFTTENAAGSAVGYLASRDPTRATYLANFIEGWQNIVHRRPWYFQTIEGLGSAWTGSFMGKDPYIGSGDGEGITVGCLEAIDLKMTALFNLYRLACWDMPYRREIIPENLRHFDVKVRITEIRNFNKSVGGLLGFAADAAKGVVGDALGIEKDMPAWEFVAKNTSVLDMTFNECEFLPDTGAKIFDTVNNVDGTLASTEFKFKYGNFTMENEFSGYPSTVKTNFRSISDADQTASGNIGSAVKDFAKSKAADMAGALADATVGKVAALAQGAMLGNVFGVRAKIGQFLNSPETLLNDAIGAGIQAIQGGQSSFKDLSALGDNVYGASAISNPNSGASVASIGNIHPLPSSPDPVGDLSSVAEDIPPVSSEPFPNVFGGSAPGPDELDSTNIFDGP